MQLLSQACVDYETLKTILIHFDYLAKQLLLKTAKS